VLLLDEFDSCPPRVLASILAALDGNAIEINGEQIPRDNNCRVIATLNGETTGFTSKQRNVLPSEILARFRTISFDGMSSDECNGISSHLVPSEIPRSKDVARWTAKVDMAIQAHFTNQTPGHRDFSRGEAAMTLRHFNAVIIIMEIGHFRPFDAYTIAYLAQLPQNERKRFKGHMSSLNQLTSMPTVRQKLKQAPLKRHIHPHAQFLGAAGPAFMAAKSELHVLFEGPTGSGLTTLAKFVSEVCIEDCGMSVSEMLRVLLGQESTFENILGALKPQQLTGDRPDVTDLVTWENGPLLEAATRGIPVILDRIDEAKA
jgi:MoxR-like ATPase